MGNSSCHMENRGPSRGCSAVPTWQNVLIFRQTEPLEQSEAVHRSISTNGQTGAADQPRDGRRATAGICPAHPDSGRPAGQPRDGRSLGVGICPGNPDSGRRRNPNSRTQKLLLRRLQKWKPMGDHLAAVRRLPFVRMSKWFCGRLQRLRME